MTAAEGFGQDLRALRSTRKMTLEDMAKALGRSVGWVSQVERGISRPSVDDVQNFAQVLDVPVSLFFGIADAPEDERGVVVRASPRREIGERDNGLVEALISPDLSDAFEVIHSTFLPGAALQQMRHRATCEVVYLISGTLDVWIDHRAFTLQAGDSFRIKDAPYRWANPYDQPACAVWVISPPVY